MNGTGASTMSIKAECLSINNPSELAALPERDELAKDCQFAQSEDLRKDMKRAGVSERPDLYFLEESKGNGCSLAKRA
jgi:hypothetical protein